MTTGSPDQGDLYQKTIQPLILAAIYLGLLNFAAFFSKMIAEKLVRREGLQRTFLIQFIATIQICAGFYEEPVLKSVGDLGFFVFNFLNFYTAGVVPNSLSAIERFTVKRKGNGEKMLTFFFAQVIGALIAPYMAVFIWSVMAGQTNRPELVGTHAKLLGTGLCHWKFESFYGPLLTQFVIAAVMRFLLTSKGIRRRSLAVPLVYAAYFTFARTFIGFPGFDPIHSLARVSHCWLRREIFVKWTLCYVFAPICGWLLFSGSSKHVENAPNETKRPNRRLRPLVDPRPPFKSVEVAKSQEAPVGKVAKEAEEEKVAIVRQNRVTRQDREPQRKFSNHQGRNHKKP
ncbi:hypothetical protein CRE_07700 [Caenorhabditis remanei]|uniref:Aquaporin n=1 Tax=Caenorhabditis remanei TaxID=31234 RepID=E3MZY2_CAERE|nr:hypothetical protein CRE_07700 [Caenorhabditis remanei]